MCWLFVDLMRFVLVVCRFDGVWFCVFLEMMEFDGFCNLYFGMKMENNVEEREQDEALVNQTREKRENGGERESPM